MSSVVTALAAGWIAGTLPAATAHAAPSGEQVIVRTYDKVGVAPPRLAAARTTAASILKDAALDIVWRECGAPAACATPLTSRELIVRIVATPDHAAPQSLGYSLIDLRDKGGSLATVLADRVDALASAAGVDAGILLGRAMAHELGHLLLGSSYHARRGLMRARWDLRELQKDLRRDWVLSRAEGKRIRQGLSARERQGLAMAGGCPPPKPAGIVQPPAPSAYPLCG